jgi:hypothetical protein
MTKRIMLYIALLLGCHALQGAPPSRAELSQLSENQVKAAYLFNFAKFVEWPASAFPSAAAPLVIGVIGKGPASEAHDALTGRSAKGRKVQVRQITRYDELAGCQVLFIAASEKPRMKEILRALPGGGVLTVSDIKHFSSSGGMIGLVSRGEKIQFEINLGNAERAGLKLSSQMLKLALSIID